LSKARKALKISSAGAATGLYAAAVVTTYYQHKDGLKLEPVDLPKVAIAATLLTTLTWIAALA
jgi:hypothetical protein